MVAERGTPFTMENILQRENSRVELTPISIDRGDPIANEARLQREMRTWLAERDPDPVAREAVLLREMREHLAERGARAGEAYTAVGAGAGGPEGLR